MQSSSVAIHIVLFTYSKFAGKKVDGNPTHDKEIEEHVILIIRCHVSPAASKKYL